MNILVFSDSHSALWFMRQCVRILKPDCIIHLGDYADDGEVIKEENPDILFYQVPGNCDGGYFKSVDAVKVCEVAGVKMLLTHGHKFQVKMGTEKLVAYGREQGVDAVLFGHTHVAVCNKETDGLWVLNPGSAGYSGAVIEICDNKITACRLIGQADLDALL